MGSVQTEAVISKEGILTGSHWGAIRATVKDGRFVAAVMLPTY
ncbi:trimethylamine-N-oxide reductase TorA domain protein [Escherichia coli 2845350]|nr:hypothetical protein [Escherichia coli]EMW40526.1 trimethylamine-N-oxide reductase TorA domain protein [Escherichia coli 2845350]